MIKINLDRAKDVAHQHRRLARTAEFAPLDIKATIPAEAEAAEAARQAIRERYADVQQQIDDATDPGALKPIVTELQTVTAATRQGA